MEIRTHTDKTIIYTNIFHKNMFNKPVGHLIDRIVINDMAIHSKEQIDYLIKFLESAKPGLMLEKGLNFYK